MTGLLLDTHVFLWYASNDPKLPFEVRSEIENEQVPVYLSGASAWEIAIKHVLGKLDLPQPISDLLDLSPQGIELLHVQTGDSIAYSQLQFPLKNHRDPFDRILAIQTQLHSLKLVTADQVFAAYLPEHLLLLVS